MHQHDIGDQNVERLLHIAYQPESIDPAFARSLDEKLCTKARALAVQRGDDVKYRTLRQRLGWAMAAAACVAVCGLILYAGRGRRSMPEEIAVNVPEKGIRWHSVNRPTTMTPRPRPDARPVKPLAVGDRLSTGAGERRRVVLVDGSVLFLNQNTTITQKAARQLELAGGEAYVEVAPRPAEETFVIKTPTRQVSVLGTHFAVQARSTGTDVIVTQGKVQLDSGEVIGAGNQIEAGGVISPAPRASHSLGWTRDLMTAAETPLVPSSKHAGGSLIAVDPNGQDVQLSLRTYHIDVHIEDGFARTTIDQTYFNNTSWRMEGTFYFPLPADAMLSRLAMYVEENRVNRLMEGGMAERAHARNVYETIRHTNRDPALLEWVDGSTFKMRVFPLEGRKEKRIILSYTQRLASVYGSSSYRFAGGHNMPEVRDWSFRALVKGGAKLSIASDPNLQVTRDGPDAILTAQEKNVKPDKDVTLELLDKTAETGDRTRFSSFTHEGADYLMVRHRPSLKSEAQRQRRNWVFLFESSGSRDPLLARAQIDVIRYMLLNAEHDDTFAVLTAGTRVRVFDDKARPATPENIAAAVKFLEGTHLIGALDLGNGLKATEPFLRDHNSHLVHVGGGFASLGESQSQVLVQTIPQGTRYVGIGVGKRWNRAFMKLAAERTSGYYRQITPDESMAWHGFDLVATLNTPRLMDVKVVDDADRAQFLAESTMLAQGEEIAAVARMDGANSRPKSITVTGQLDGKPFRRVLRVENVAANAGYLPRAWARLELDRLIADGAEKNKARIIDLSKASYVMSPFTSLLVLETDADYERFKVDRGRKDHWAMYPCPERTPIVHEPETAIVENKTEKGEKQSAVERVMRSILVRIPPPVLRYSNHGDWMPSIVTAWGVYGGHYGLGIDDLIGLGRGPLNGQSERIRVLALDPAIAQTNVEAALTRFDAKWITSMTWSSVQGGMEEEAMKVKEADLTALQAQALTEAARIREENKIILQMQKENGELRNVVKAEERLAQTTQDRNIRLLERIQELTRAKIGGGDTKNMDASLNEFWVPNPWDSTHNPSGDVLRAWPVGDLVLPILKGPAEITDSNLATTHYSRRGLPWFESSDWFPRATVGLGTGTMASYVRPNRHVRFYDIGLPVPISARKSLYERLTFTGAQHFFNDLTIYAVGLNTSRADILAVLEGKTLGPPPRAGMIDPRAGDLVRQVRAVDWQAVTIPDNKEDFTITFNGSGRYSWQRTLSSGLHEVVECDGSTLLHMYPEIGAGAKRQVSRFHRAELAELVPWFVLPVEDLARGADVKLIDRSTIAVVPHSPDGGANEMAAHVHLVFGPDGRLCERRWIAMPGGKIVLREVYDANGTVTWFGDSDKKVAEVKLRVRPAQPVKIDVDKSRLLWFHMPLRTDGVASHGSRMSEHVKLDMLDAGPKSFVRQLKTFRKLWQRWNDEGFAKASAEQLHAERVQLLSFVKESAPLFAWALLDVGQRGAGADAEFQRGLAEAYKRLANEPGLEYFARYEQARCLLNAGQNNEAGKAFEKLYTDAARDTDVPPIDSAFRSALGGQDRYAPLMRQAAAGLIKNNRLGRVLALARQNWQLEEKDLANELVTKVLCAASAKLKTSIALVGLDFFIRTDQPARADGLLQDLLKDERVAGHVGAWRLAANLAERLGKYGREVACLEKAIELEYRDLPEVIDLQKVRGDFGKLLALYHKQALALSLDIDVPADFLAKVVRAADRWRSLDGDGTQPCRLAAQVLQTLGQRELAWDYLTTPIDLRPNESAPWLEVAQITRDDDIELTHRAYSLAFQAEPTNAQILWDHAQYLQRFGRLEQSRQVYQQLADGDWQPRFQGLRDQARRELAGP